MGVFGLSSARAVHNHKFMLGFCACSQDSTSASISVYRCQFAVTSTLSKVDFDAIPNIDQCKDKGIHLA